MLYMKFVWNWPRVSEEKLFEKVDDTDDADDTEDGRRITVYTISSSVAFGSGGLKSWGNKSKRGFVLLLLILVQWNLDQLSGQEHWLWIIGLLSLYIWVFLRS